MSGAFLDLGLFGVSRICYPASHCFIMVLALCCASLAWKWCFNNLSSLGMGHVSGFRTTNQHRPWLFGHGNPVSPCHCDLSFRRVRKLSPWSPARWWSWSWLFASLGKAVRCLQCAFNIEMREPFTLVYFITFGKQEHFAGICLWQGLFGKGSVKSYCCLPFLGWGRI